MKSREQVVLWSLVAVIVLLVSLYFYATVKRSQATLAADILRAETNLTTDVQNARNNLEADMRAGIETFVSTKVNSIESAFANLAEQGFTRQEFNDFVRDFIVPITSASGTVGDGLQSILILRHRAGVEFICSIMTPGAEVGQKVIPCDNVVLDTTWTENSFFSSSREKPRSKEPAMYLTRLISLPDDPLFHADDYMLLADWNRRDRDAAIDAMAEVRTKFHIDMVVSRQRSMAFWIKTQIGYWAVSMLVILSVGFLLDKTYRRVKYEQRLLESIFAYSSDGLVVARATESPEDGGEIVLVNRAMEKLTGRRLKGTIIRDLMPDRYVDKHNVGFQKVTEGADSDVIDDINRDLLYVLDKQGNEIPSRIIPNKFRLDGEMMVIATVADVTTIVEQAEDIEKLEAEKTNLLELYMAAQRDLIAATRTNTEILNSRHANNV